MRYTLPLGFAAVALACASLVYAARYVAPVQWEKPPVVTPGDATHAPSDAVVLFDGKDMSQWNGAEKWQVADGAVMVGGGDITSKESFGDCQLHIEWMSPIEAKGSGQDRGNSGVFLMKRYEVQVLDSYESETYFEGQAGSIYNQKPPMVNACRKPGDWQTYDIIFQAPRRSDDGSIKTPAYITVLHNGVLIQNHYEIKGNTWFDKAPAYEKHADKEPIQLQFHGHPVKYRNIWVRPLNLD